MTAAGRDIDALVAELTLDEKAALTAGEDLWSTVAVARVGIPKVRVTDGPSGARGSTFGDAGPTTAVCIPCGSALGATWNPGLVERVGAMLGDEARTKQCRVLLAPTVNIHRSPLAGRNFECYSEDPLLSGLTAAAFVRGVQSRRVATTVKHFAGNEAEFERTSMDSQIDERALREIYLVPFELAVRDGGALGVMTGYNRLNGTWCAEHAGLIGLLRGEWGFDGFVVSDWYAVGSTTASPVAGLDLEMPGPGRFYGPALAAAVRSGAVEEALVDQQLRRLLTVFERIGALDDPAGEEEQSIDRPEHRALAREAAAESMVLLRNQGVLPFDGPSLRSLAVVGPNARRASIMGGGSAALRPHYRISPLEAIRAGFDGVEVRHERGCDIDQGSRTLAGPQLSAADGSPGLQVEFFADPDFGGAVVHRIEVAEARLVFFGEPGPGVPAESFSFRATARWTPYETGEHTLTMVQAGRGRVLVDGVVVLDGVADPPPPGTEFLGAASEEMSAAVAVEAGRAHEIRLEYSSHGATFLRGMKVGCRLPDPPGLMDRAVRAAADCDAAIVIAGTNDDWESEGHDRQTLALPGDQDELIRRVVAANPRTVVVVNTGAPVTMDWAEEAPAILQAWFGGQEMANALADVLAGRAEPAGRLPTTFPIRVEHTPPYGSFPGDNGAVRYAESILVGYRWYEARHLPGRFAFGHGLSYTTVVLGEPRVSATELAPGQTLTIEVPVTNTGERRGAEVVQCYVAPAQPRLLRPPKELKGFAKAWLDPGETATVSLELGDRAFAYWDPGDPDWPDVQERLVRTTVSAATGAGHRTQSGWYVDRGRYDLIVGRSSVDARRVASVTVVEDRRLE